MTNTQADLEAAIGQIEEAIREAADLHATILKDSLAARKIHRDAIESLLAVHRTRCRMLANMLRTHLESLDPHDLSIGIKDGDEDGV